MSLVTISEASRLTGKSDKTIYRHISDGSLSVSQREDGTKVVETSELQRRYGDLGVAREEKRNGQKWGNENGDTLELRIENARLSEKVLGLERLIEEKDKRLLTYEINNSKQVAAPEIPTQEISMAKGKTNDGYPAWWVLTWALVYLITFVGIGLAVNWSMDHFGYEWQIDKFLNTLFKG